MDKDFLPSYVLDGVMRDEAGHYIMKIRNVITQTVYEAISFSIEVRKNYSGELYYVVKADSLLNDKPLMVHIWLLKTRDINAAFDLKNALDEMIGQLPSCYQRKHCV